MLHPHTELRHAGAAIGYGVFVTHFIPRGTITWVQDGLDQVLTAGKVSSLEGHLVPHLEKYTFVDGRGRRILCWDFARMMNHHCEANTFSPGTAFEIAVRDIQVGEQLTSDYGALNIEGSFACACGSSRCRGTIHPDDWERLSPEWDRQVADAFPAIREVEQPLWYLVEETAVIDAGLASPARIPSIRRHQWPKPAAAQRGRARAGMGRPG